MTHFYVDIHALVYLKVHGPNGKQRTSLIATKQNQGYCRTIDGDQAAVIGRKGKNEL